MTFFLLLVTIAVVIPFATIAFEAAHLEMLGSIDGVFLATAAGAVR